MRPDGKTVTVACSDHVAVRVDELQYELDDGPCLHAMRDGHMVRIEDTAEKAPLARVRGAGRLTRYPVVPGPAAKRGRRAGRRPQPVRPGGLGVRDGRGAVAPRISPESASGALSLAMRLASDAALIDQLRSSLTSRSVIDQALGIIMAREHCNQARAFAILRSASQNSNVKLRDIASAVVTSVTGEPPPPPPFGEGRRLGRP